MTKQTILQLTLTLAAAAETLLGGGLDTLETAVYRQIADQLRADRVDLCEGRAVGQAFEIRGLSSSEGDRVIASYTLIRYESCEEGAAYWEERRSENWAKTGGKWVILSGGTAESATDRLRSIAP